MSEQKQTTQRDDDRKTKAEKPYDREAKLKEILEQDEKRSPYVDTFMGF